MSKTTKRTRTAGQPTKFRQAFIREAEKVCKQEGYTVKQLAKHFKVSVRTICNWKLSHPEFAVAVRDGKDHFDTREVNQLLLRRCRGWDYDEKTYKVIDGELTQVRRVTKHLPSDTTAIIFWLKNRDPQRWSEKQAVTHGFTLADFMKMATKEKAADE